MSALFVVAFNLCSIFLQRKMAVSLSAASRKIAEFFLARFYLLMDNHIYCESLTTITQFPHSFLRSSSSYFDPNLSGVESGASSSNIFFFDTRILNSRTRDVAWENTIIQMT